MKTGLATDCCAFVTWAIPIKLASRRLTSLAVLVRFEGLALGVRIAKDMVARLYQDSGLCSLFEGYRSKLIQFWEEIAFQSQKRFRDS